jgi:hypothetical protein
MKCAVGLRRLLLGAAFCVLMATSVWCQEAKDAKPAEPEKKATFTPPLARLAAAKTVYLKRGSGSDVAFDVISAAVEGWGRYAVVTDIEKADLVIEVNAPEESGGVTFSSSTNTNTVTGRPEQSTSSNRQISSGGGPVRMVVYDPKTKAQLFFSSEIAKGAMKAKNREDNLVEAAQKLFLKFHDRVEPPPR